MSESPSRSSHALTWTLVVLVGLPVLYFVTAPLLYCFVYAHWGTDPMPTWLDYFLAPAAWLTEGTPFHKTYAAYWEWCTRLYFGQ